MTKTKFKTYWKVVGKTRHRSLESISLDLAIRLKYRIGRITKPKIGKIFCFRTRKNAREFKIGGEILLKVLAPEGYVTNFIPCGINYKNTWERYKKDPDAKFGEAQRVPNGTVLVDYVKPIEISH